MNCGCTQRMAQCHPGLGRLSKPLQWSFALRGRGAVALKPSVITVLGETSEPVYGVDRTTEVTLLSAQSFLVCSFVKWEA